MGLGFFIVSSFHASFHDYYYDTNESKSDCVGSEADHERSSGVLTRIRNRSATMAHARSGAFYGAFLASVISVFSG
jgi:hypothetical protein